MTRSFLTRSAVAIVPLAIGLAIVYGDNSWYDRLIATYSIAQVIIVLATLTFLLAAIVWWVGSAWRFRKLPSAIIAVISIACLCGQRAEAFSMVATNVQPPTVQIDQPFTLPADEQRQVDAAIEQAVKEAKDNPGFVVSVELAIGIAIGIIIIGTTAIIVVRLVCKSLRRMQEDMRTRLGKLKEFLENPTNPPVLIGAGLFLHRTATTNDIQSGLEFNLRFVSYQEPVTITGTITGGETVWFDDFLKDLGVLDNWPLDAATGQGVSRVENGYAVALNGYTNFVTLGFESTTNLLQGSWKRVLNLTVPAGALIDFADLTGESANRFWRTVESPTQ